jgi:Helix-turn-helix domain
MCRRKAMENWPQYMATDTAARYLDVPVATLVSWRQQGVGPAWLRVGKRLVRYEKRVLDEFMGTSAGKVLGEPGPKLQRERADV